jgi:hypothetical protein
MSEDDVKTIAVAGSRVGMMGLDGIFAELKETRKTPSDELANTLVELAAKLNYIPDGARAEYGRALLREYRRFLGEIVPEEHTGLSIIVLGAGCRACEQLATNVRTALAQMEIPAQVEQVSDLKKMAEYNVIGTPALIVNGKVKSVGRPLSVQQIVKLLSDVVKA